MSRPSRDDDRDTIATAVAEAFAAAEFRPEAAPSPVTPLRLLIAEQPVLVDEVKGLTRGTAASYLLAETGRPMTIEGEQAEPLSGFLFANARGGWILVNRDTRNPLVRRRFSVAHELGHYLLHFRPLLRTERDAQFTEALTAAGDVDDAAADTGSVSASCANGEGATKGWDPERMEEEANQFAAAVLMPELTCRRRIEELGPRYGDRADPLARRLASDFLVSQTAMQRRLRALGLL